MPGISRNKKKWWHETLTIRNRDSGDAIVTLTTVNPADPSENANPAIINAYGTYNVDCASAVEIPVPSFDPVLSPGYFLFRPSIDDLEEAIIDIQTYQEAINLNKRHIFEFTRNAAYDQDDTDCSGVSPNQIDSLPYEVVTNSLNSNVFRYPELPLYTQIGCCQVELSIPGVDLPLPGRIGRATRVWYISYDGSQYSLYSYDFALTTSALVFRGNIDLPIVITKIFDLTWLPIDNSLVILTDSGIYRLSPGDATNDAIIGNKIEIQGITNTNMAFFPMTSTETSLYKCSFEYNYFNNLLYAFLPMYITAGSLTFVYPVFLKLRYESNHFAFVSFSYVSQMMADPAADDKSIGGFVFSQNSDPLGIYNDNLSYLRIVDNQFSNLERVTTEDPSADLLAGMTTLSFATHPDAQISDNRIYATNAAGQLFSVNASLGSANSLSDSLGASPIGCTTTLNGEDSRIQPFPFILGQSHWLFMVDTSSTMAGNRLPLVKQALIDMLTDYVRYGDKITVMWFSDTYGKITKELRTYSDANEVITFINTYFITPASGLTNFCNPFSNISQDFTDLKGIFILSDGTFDDCGTSTPDWQLSLSSSVSSILSANSGVVFTTVGVRVSSGTEKLEYIAQVSGGVYTNWT